MLQTLNYWLIVLLFVCMGVANLNIAIIFRRLEPSRLRSLLVAIFWTSAVRQFLWACVWNNPALATNFFIVLISVIPVFVAILKLRKYLHHTRDTIHQKIRSDTTKLRRHE